MKKVDPAAIAAFHANDPLAATMRVVDAKSGDAIGQVIDADVAAGKVRRYAVEDGLLVREHNAFKVVEEDRAVRIEKIEPIADDKPAAGDIGSVDA